MNFDGFFDGMIFGLLAIGALLGAVFYGLIQLAIYLCHHVTIGWTP